MEEKYKIHAFYIVAILLTIIVILITVKWSDIPGLADYISFALSVFSIGLAVLAIIYSIISNTSFLQNIRTLDISAKRLHDVSSELGDSTIRLTKKVDSIPDVIKDVSDKIDETHDLINNISMPRYGGLTSDNDLSEIQTGTLSVFLEKSSFNGLLLLYALKLSYQREKRIDFDSLYEGIGENKDYAFAYFIATHSFGLFSYDHSFKGGQSYKVTEYNQFLEQEIDKALNEKMNEISDEYLEKATLEKIVSSVQGYFVDLHIGEDEGAESDQEVQG